MYVLVSGVMTALFVALSFAMPWSRWPRRICLIFPVLVWLAIAALGLGANGVGANYLGLFTLSFLYIGLTQPVGTGTALLPVAALMFVSGEREVVGANAAPADDIALTVYLLVAETLAVLQRRRRRPHRPAARMGTTDALTGSDTDTTDLDIQYTATRPGDLVVLCDIDHFARSWSTTSWVMPPATACWPTSGCYCAAACAKATTPLATAEFAVILAMFSRCQQASMVLDRLRTRWALLQREITFSTGSATCWPTADRIDAERGR